MCKKLKFYGFVYLHVATISFEMYTLKSVKAKNLLIVIIILNSEYLNVFFFSSVKHQLI